MRRSSQGSTVIEETTVQVTYGDPLAHPAGSSWWLIPDNWAGRGLLAAAILAVVWSAIRAYVQSITIDEATTYVAFLRYGEAKQWTAASNNHLLNTMLMRLSTRLFGVSDFTLRVPTLMGAAMYVGSVYRLCRGLEVSQVAAGGFGAASRVAQWGLLLCLVYNPFVMDFMVAARGYGMALGFLMLAIAAVAGWHLEGRQGSPVLVAGIASAAVALSFASNFAFAFACAFVWLALLAWTWMYSSVGRLALIGAFVAPATVLTVIVPLPMVLDWPEGQLWFGSENLREMWESMRGALLTRLNPEFVNSIVGGLYEALEPFLIPVSAGLSLLWLGVLAWRGGRVQEASERNGRRLALELSAVLGFSAAATLGALLILHRGFDVLLPKDRTTLYFVPLVIGALFIPLTVSGKGLGRGFRTLRGVAIGSQLLLASYFVFCLRSEYFEEWYWNADTRQAHEALQCFYETEGIEYVTGGWAYPAALNFYRDTEDGPTYRTVYAEADTLPTAVAAKSVGEPRLWVLNQLHDPGMMEREGLVELSRDPFTLTMIAALPELAERLRGSSCIELHVRQYP